MSLPPAAVAVASNPPALAHGQTHLTDWGVIRAQGAEAAKFLHGQLTQDFSLLGLSEARLAAFCSAKGRMLSSFVGFKLAADDVLLLCPRDVLPATLKRLSMFVMRAQCTLSNATEAFDLYGLAGPGADALAQSVGLNAATWAKANLGDALPDNVPAALVRLPPAGEGPLAVTRLLACVPTGQPLPSTLPPMDGTEWAWLAVQSGVAMVTLPLVEAFVPQMLNYESVGGVNFKKGCYPGQEVVARSQYRGTLKRRTYRVAAEQPLSVGQEVFHSGDAEQPCGTVVATATLGTRCEALVSMQTAAAAGGQLSAGTADGPTLTLLPLPYALLQEV